MAQLEAMMSSSGYENSSSNKRNFEVDHNEEIITDGFRKKGRLTLVGERADFLESLAVQGIQEIQQLKTVDESHHQDIVNLGNIAGLAQEERQNVIASDHSAHAKYDYLYQATATEVEALKARTFSLEEQLPQIKEMLANHSQCIAVLGNVPIV